MILALKSSPHLSGTSHATMRVLAGGDLEHPLAAGCQKATSRHTRP